MPRIDDPSIVKRPFKKKAYRPWSNLLDDDFAIAPKAEQQEEKRKEEPVATPLEATTEKDSVVSIESPIIAVAEDLVQPLTVSSIDLEKVTPIDQPIEIHSIMVTKRESDSNQSVTIEKSISNHKDTVHVDPVNKLEPLSNRISNQYGNQISERETSNNVTSHTLISAAHLIQRTSGLQKKILFHIIEDCILNGSLSSSPISNESIMRLVNADRDTIKTAIQRMIRKNLISRGFGKPGRGGFAIFNITDDMRNAFIDQKRNPSYTGIVTNWLPNQEPIGTYSSSSNINTTTKEVSNENSAKFSSTWEKIDIEPLNSIGFTKAHLQQIIMADKLASEIVQDSIYAFAFDIENNNKQKTLRTSPLNYFMGIMRTGTPYAPPANYESPQDKAMRIYLESKRLAAEKRDAMENELFQRAFNDWDLNLSQTDRDAILPETIKNSRLTAERTVYLRTYFKEKLWSNLREQYLSTMMEGALT